MLQSAASTIYLRRITIMAQNIQAALQQLNTLILGKEDVLKQLLACILADGHVLLEDVPGVGKTTLAHGVAAVLGLDYRRVQFTNDMLPSDLLGINIYRPNEGKFEFHPGPRVPLLPAGRRNQPRLAQTAIRPA